jgi:branched-chain amino acid transport system permease protein
MNFAFIVFQAAGAYTAAVLTLGPQSASGYQHYLGGAALPFPLPLIAAAAVGALLAVPIGLIGLRRLRSDYQAMIFLVVSLIATDVAESQSGLVNGTSGLFQIPQPLASEVSLSPIGYQWFYLGLSVAMCVLVYWVVHRVTGAPLGRALRAMRDSPEAAAAVGKDVAQLRMLVFVLGGGIAGLSGGLLAGYVSAWAPGSWLYPETFVYLAAVIVGGRGNNFGVMLGALLVPGFGEIARFFPHLLDPQVSAALEWMGIGAFMLVFLWFWPRGIVPERRRKFAPTERPPPRAAAEARAPGQ